MITCLLTERQVLHRPALYLSHCLKRHRQESSTIASEADQRQGRLAKALAGVFPTRCDRGERRSRRDDATCPADARATSSRNPLSTSAERRATVIGYTSRCSTGQSRSKLGEIQQLTGTSYAAANQLVARMCDIGILREMTGYSRNRRFRYDAYVRLFTDDPEEAPEPSEAPCAQPPTRGSVLVTPVPTCH